MEINKKNVVISSNRYLRISSSKVRRVLNQIIKYPLKCVFVLLNFLSTKSSYLIKNIILNAVNKFKLFYGNCSNLESLYLIEARADSGSILKRSCPHSRGRAFPIKKSTCHITSLV